MGRKSQFFRANVGAVICDEGGRVLAFERADVPGAWQLPQGGLEAGEEPERAVLREVLEETGIEPPGLEPLGRHPTLLAYELPAALRTKKTGRGQVQYWFYFRLAQPGVAPRLAAGGEFRAWRFCALEALAGETAEFRRPVYAALAAHLSASLSAPARAGPAERARQND